MTSEFARGVLETVDRESLIPPGTVVVCGFSGGPDSTALVRVLLDLAGELRCHVVAAHLDHALRDESASDADACQALAAEWGVRFRRDRIDWERRGGVPHSGVEATSRTLRYEFLARVAREERGCIAVGHHAGDRAETFLAQLVRGAGPRGLSLPRYRREDGVIRPLLDRTRAQIVAFLEERGIPWREDATNQDGSNLRSRIRRDVLPLLERENPEAAAAIARASRLLADGADFLDRAADRALEELRTPGKPGEFALDGPKGRTYDRIVLSCLLGRAARALGSGEAVALEPLDRLVTSWQRGESFALDLPGRVRMTVDARRVVVARTGQAAERFAEREVPVPGDVLWANESREPGRVDVHLTVERAEPPRDPGSVSGPRCAWLDAERIVGGLRIRSRRPGDRYRPLGRGGSVKLQDLFVDRKIERARRDSVPVIVDRAGILWVPGFPVDQRGRLTETTRTALRLEVREGPPPAPGNA
jgi:tRNA(Ile)-lysidine synthase